MHHFLKMRSAESSGTGGSGRSSSSRTSSSRPGSAMGRRWQQPTPGFGTRTAPPPADAQVRADQIYKASVYADRKQEKPCVKGDFVESGGMAHFVPGGRPMSRGSRSVGSSSSTMSGSVRSEDIYRAQRERRRHAEHEGFKAKRPGNLYSRKENKEPAAVVLDKAEQNWAPLGWRWQARDNPDISPEECILFVQDLGLPNDVGLRLYEELDAENGLRGREGEAINSSDLEWFVGHFGPGGIDSSYLCYRPQVLPALRRCVGCEGTSDCSWRPGSGVGSSAFGTESGRSRRPRSADPRYRSDRSDDSSSLVSSERSFRQRPASARAATGRPRSAGLSSTSSGSARRGYPKPGKSLINGFARSSGASATSEDGRYLELVDSAHAQAILAASSAASSAGSSSCDSRRSSASYATSAASTASSGGHHYRSKPGKTYSVASCSDRQSDLWSFERLHGPMLQPGSGRSNTGGGRSLLSGSSYDRRSNPTYDSTGVALAVGSAITDTPPSDDIFYAESGNAVFACSGDPSPREASGNRPSSALARKLRWTPSTAGWPSPDGSDARYVSDLEVFKKASRPRSARQPSRKERTIHPDVFRRLMERPRTM